MQITLREAAAYLGVSEATARRWIGERELPVHRVNERIYLNAVEVWEWAVEHGVSASRRLLERARQSPDVVAPMSDLLRAGGIFHDVDAPDKAALLRVLVDLLPLPTGDRKSVV